MNDMQANSPVLLRALHTIEGAGQALELSLHKRFAALRMHGEWFSDAPELLDYIAELRKSTA